MSEKSWEMTETDAKRYEGYYLLLAAGGAGSVSRLQAEPLFERAALNVGEVDQIWALADVDNDGRLNPSEFRVAMHLATLAVQGRGLPQRLPQALERTAFQCS